MHHYHSHRPSPLEIKQLAEFDASLGDISESDKRKRRIIYLRDAMQQISIGKTIFKGFGLLILIPFILIPIFWPFLAFFWFMKKKATGLMDTQVTNALEYWNIQRSEVDQNHF
jgi:hypothetical protein